MKKTGEIHDILTLPSALCNPQPTTATSCPCFTCDDLASRQDLLRITLALNFGETIPVASASFEDRSVLADVFGGFCAFDEGYESINDQEEKACYNIVLDLAKTEVGACLD